MFSDKVSPAIVPVVVCVATVWLTGCGTTGGGNQLESTIYDTHRRVARLDKSLEDSVNQLNQTTADLSARVDQEDQRIRTLQSVVEENQVKLDKLQSDLERLAATLYRNLGWTTPDTAQPAVVPGAGAQTGSETGVGQVEVTPPRQTPPQTAASGAETSGEQPAEREDIFAGTAGRPGGDPEADYQKAQQAYAGEDYARALELFDAYLQRYPNTELAGNAQFWKAYCCYHLGRHEEAIADFDKLLTKYPASTKAPYAMHIQALAYKELGHPKRAAALLQEVIENYPMTPAADRSKSELEKLQGS